MSKTHIHHRRRDRFASVRRTLPVLALGALAVIGSFGLGLQSSGNVQPIGSLEAHEATVQVGDMNGDGTVDVEDVAVVIDILLGRVDPGPQQYTADPTPDGRFTLEDAATIAAIASQQ